MNDIARLFIGLFLILLGVFGSVIIIRFVPGSYKALGIPAGIILIILGAWLTGWI